MFDVAAGPWSAEGLTVYTTYRIVKDLYDEDYAQKNYVESWRQAVDDYNLNFYVATQSIWRLCRRSSGWKSREALPLCGSTARCR